MYAQTLVMLLNTFYVVMMGLVALVGTMVLVKLLLVFLHDKPHPKRPFLLETEDA